MVCALCSSLLSLAVQTTIRPHQNIPLQPQSACACASVLRAPNTKHSLLFLFDPCANPTTILSLRNQLYYILLFLVYSFAFVLRLASCFDSQILFLLHVRERFDGCANAHLPAVPLKTDSHYTYLPCPPQIAPNEILLKLAAVNTDLDSVEQGDVVKWPG